ncbi:LacI family transcriptional regulator [Motilibacter peucedani]|uniref:LacI family transcriptional regulator n=1 Tax=Motilibacter peucedani TaxID=598650 RepID=A0A420XQG9_9ACTN|nr:LacI family DNA-binding transcriptional regulator [Motilibacter peucedani]RKS75466.1 LacI family transcriptional regulator [Motilibacter peucedani]
MSSAGIRDVATLAQVSVGTVSNVLNRPDAVAPATRQRVEHAIEQLGFVRNEAARSLRAGRSRTIGLLVLDVANPFFTDVAAGAEAAADASGAVITLYNSGQSRERESRHLAHLEEQRVQGVLVTPVDTRNPRLDRLVERGTPVVLVDRGADRADRCSVSVDDVRGGSLALEHLLSRGHTRTAFVGGPLDVPQVIDRYRGATRAVEAQTGATLSLTETSGLTVEDGRRAGELLAAMPASRRPTAAFCANDLIALGLLQAMTAAGLRVPGDLAIVGYDDIYYAAAAAVPLTSVRQPRELLGRTAAELLLEEINDDGLVHAHRQVVFEPELVVRASSDVRRPAARKRAPKEAG